MPITQYLLLHFSPIFVLFLILSLFVALAVAGLATMHFFVSHKRLKIHNDVAGPIFTNMGVIYAVVLAFVVIVTWENFDKANTNTQREANFLADLYTDAGSFPEASKREIRTLLKDYTVCVIKDEWRDLGKGEESPLAQAALEKIWKFYNNFSPSGITQVIFFYESVQKLNQLNELRRMRIEDSRTGVHPILWFVLLAGGVLVIVFSFFFGTENFGAQIIMTILLSALIAFTLFAILELDFPFTGRVSIQPEAFQHVLSCFV